MESSKRRRRILFVQIALVIVVFTAAIVAASVARNPNAIFVSVLVFILIVPTLILSAWAWTKLLGWRR